MVETVALPTTNVKAVVKFLQKNIFSRFGTPKTIISDERTHFCNRAFATTLAKYESSTRLLQRIIHK